MTGRFEIRETTSYLNSAEGLQEVTILDKISGTEVRGIAATYDEAVRQAWQKLKQLQVAGAPGERDNTGEYI